MIEKTCLITGGAGGIGRAIAVALRNRGARVIVVDLQDRPAPDGVHKIGADLSSRVNINEMLDQVHSDYDRLDVLINNVGGIFPERVETADGIEMTFALNYLSSFIITLGLVGILRRSAPSLVVNVSSSHHRAGRIDFDNLQGEKKYDMNKAYCQSKLADVMFTTELAKRIEGSGVATIAVHPGATNSGFGDVLPGFWGFMWRISSPFRKEPERAGESIAELVYSPDVFDHNGGYYADGKRESVSKRAMDSQVSKRLWLDSLKLSGVTDSI